MTELAGDTKPAFVSPDATHVWWGGTWVLIDPRALSPDRKWIMLDGQWRPLFRAPGAAGQTGSAYVPFADGVYPANAGSNGETNGFSVASLVLAIVWLLGMGSLLAVVFGHRLLPEGDQQPHYGDLVLQQRQRRRHSDRLHRSGSMSRRTHR